jgi:hypothetical protein
MTQESAQLLRAVKGPVMMITIGVLFALDNFTPLSFGRTWPVLLVVVGVLSLGKTPPAARAKFQYQAWGPPQPATPVPPAPPSPATPTPSGIPTSGPGTYRGSTYQGTPGAPSAARGSERPSENRERPAAADANPNSPPGMGGGTL